MRLKSYLAMVLLVLFGLSQLPFHAFHAHNQDHHVLIDHLQNKENHHCDLDDFACQDGIIHSCDHNSHIGKPIPKCFECQFHQLKPLALVQTNPLLIETSMQFLFATIKHSIANRNIPKAANKGPPSQIA